VEFALETSTMPATLDVTAVRCHISLNVSNLDRSVAFYRILFGLEPAKRRGDYAKFELIDPPLVLSLEPTRPAVGGVLNHLGFRLPDSATLVEMQRRLEAAGIPSQREEGVECCYARQTKFWITDPDRTLWEIYVLEEDINHRGAGQTLEQMLPQTVAAPAPEVTWEHRLFEPVPDAIPLENETATEVRLQGSFNADLPEAARLHLVQEARRVLRPGGRVQLHQLVADRPLPGGLRPLPGPAAYVRRVPPESEPLRVLEEAGFVNLALEKFGGTSCFEQDGIGMREMLLSGRKPLGVAAPSHGQMVVLYKGPFRQITDDQGQVYRRGERVAVSAATGQQLRAGPYADQFTFFAAGGGHGCS
jgi:catechol 2,3-dioxygenase-like lactoylglutathione lyase family enzyme